jgi:hypothetical protein
MRHEQTVYSSNRDFVPRFYLRDAGQLSGWGKESRRCQPASCGQASAQRHAGGAGTAGFGSALRPCPTFASSDPWERRVVVSRRLAKVTQLLLSSSSLLFCLPSPSPSRQSSCERGSRRDASNALGQPLAQAQTRTAPVGPVAQHDAGPATRFHPTTRQPRALVGCRQPQKCCRRPAARYDARTRRRHPHVPTYSHRRCHPQEAEAGCHEDKQ